MSKHKEAMIAQDLDAPLTLNGVPLYPRPPAPQDIPDLIAGALGVSRGTAYDMMREALAEAQQEPICKMFGSLPVYDRPAQPLTDEQIWEFWWSRPEVPEGEDDSMEAEFVAAVRAVLAAHGITKGTP